MKILDCSIINDLTMLVLDEDLPFFAWHMLSIDGKLYKPRMVMGASKNVIAIEGNYDLVGYDVTFV